MLNQLRCIVAKCSNGQTKRGVEFGSSILYSQLKDKYKFQYDNTHTFIEKDQFSREYDYKGYHKIYQDVQAKIKSNKIPLLLGGDHSVSLASVPAVCDIYEEDISIIWVDAHADINTPETSTTGNLHGMPLASALQIMEPIVKPNYQIKYDQLFYIGLRSIDEPEKKLLDEKKITYFEYKDIEKNGIEKIFEIIKKKTKHNIHLSFDIDAMDPTLTPSTGTPEVNGIKMEEVNYFIDNLKKTKKITSVDFVEFNPWINPNKSTKTLKNSLTILENIIS